MNGETSVTAITGGASGIGRSTAELLCHSGQKVAILDISQQRCDETSDMLGGNAIGIACDVTNTESLAQSGEQIEAHFGRVDGLVNCAGIAQRPGSAFQLHPEDLDRLYEVHVKGAFLACREFASRMIRQGRGGAIVNLASVVAVRPGPTYAYAPAKAAVRSMTISMAAEWAGSGIRVNSVSPGWTDTPFLGQRATEDTPRNKDRLKNAMLLGRLLSPREVANVIVFLLSSEASGVIGSDFIVDGGFLAAGGFAPYSELDIRGEANV